MKIYNYYWQLATDRGSLLRALKIALTAGLILNLINNTNLFIYFSVKDVNLLKVALTFIVPFTVSLYSSVSANSKTKPYFKENKNKIKYKLLRVLRHRA